MKRIAACLCTIVVLLTSSYLSFGQVATGTPQFGSFGGGPFDVVNLGNLNVHFAVPILHKAGRGVDFAYDLSYDSSVWYPVVSNGNTSWQPVLNWGWRGPTETTSGYVTFTQGSSSPACFFGGNSFGMQYTQSNWTYHDPIGSTHVFTGTTTHYVGSPAYCPADTPLTVTAVDGSGWTLSAVGITVQKVTAASGKVINPVPVNSTGGAATVTDANGNQVTVNGSNQFFDTLSSTTPVLTVSGSGTPSSPLKFGYVPPANVGTGTLVYVQVNYLQYTVKTNFGATDSQGHAIGEFGSTSVPLVSNITLPDGSAYSFLYEHTPGTCTPLSGTFSGYCVTARIASVTLPTGGQITYSYSGGANGIVNDGSAAGLTRTLNPGGTWTYARSGSGTLWGTTVNDAQTPSNQTSINFSKDSATTSNTNNFYETWRLVRQGSSTTLETFFNCYNNNFANCQTAPVASPITKKDAYSALNNGNTDISETTYDNFGLPTEHKDFDWGQLPVTDTVTIYNRTLGNGIVDRPDTITVKDAGGTVKATTSYKYDESALVSSGVTQQHVSVTGSRGNVTTVTSQVNGTTNLYRKFTYYDTGSLSTSTDLSTSSSTNGAATTYNYAAGTASCNNAFVTSLTEPLSLSRSMTWDCTGGALLSVTDENVKTVSVSYTDPYFWRPVSTTDQANSVTSFSYLNPTRTESVRTFNSGASAVDNVIQLDGFGRVIVSQTRQAPGSSSYDSVETDYNPVGQVSKVTIPYSGAAGALCSGTCPGTSTSYDGLGRILSTTDAGGGSASYTYSQNDVLQTLSPAPTGENTKRKQMEYDGLGRLISVCEVTSASGSGACAQVGSQPTGYWTTYGYDVLNRLTLVTQNAQAASGSRQTRTYAYDMLGRLTSETNPETGTASYAYDTVASGCSNFGDNQSGNLVAKTDANGNTTCYHADALHRLADVGVSGPNSTPCKRFRYDTATNGVNGSAPSGVAVSNVKGRLMEAETDNCGAWPPTPITDEWFSYSARGEAVDLYESTPHSGGYYHFVASYWEHGLTKTISSPITGYYMAYGVDGEGRPYSATAGSGQNPVTSVSYASSGSNPPVGSLTQVVYGSGDSDSFGYDPAGRMASYTYNVNGQSIVGNLTWNNNGTLNKLQITDPVNSGNSQTCTYGHDDLVRIASAKCTGSLWGQTFAYDAFGNDSKTVPGGYTGISFLPTYSGSTNRFTSIPGMSVSYDANGNLTADGTHTYTWNADGRPVTVDSVNVTYDALSRPVEQARGASFIEFAYDPTGHKAQAMNGQSGGTAIVALPGGGTAIYGAQLFYRHPDWLGSSRLTTTASRTLYYDGGYAPFGENYAGSGTTDLNFTGQVQDTVSGLYDFPFREYSPTQGRWISPDPAGLAAANLADPQSWNLYAYASNSPLDTIDPLGLCTIGQSVTSGWTITITVSLWPCPTLQPWLTTTNFGCFLTGLCNIPAQSGGSSAGGGSAGVTNGTNPANNKKPCTNVPKSPPGESATANLNEVNQSTQGMWPATKLWYLNLVFRTGGAFDYKTTYGSAGWGNPDQFVDYGNWNFGYVCGGNYPTLFCQSMAGSARMWRSAGQGKNPFGNGIPFLKAPYGDQARDSQQIQSGSQAEASGCVQ